MNIEHPWHIIRWGCPPIFRHKKKYKHRRKTTILLYAWWVNHVKSLCIYIYISIIYPNEPCSKCLVSWHQYVLLTRTQVLLTRISCLTLSLCWFTLIRVLLTPHPYQGPLPKHERKGLARGSNISNLFHDFQNLSKNLTPGPHLLNILRLRDSDRSNALASIRC